MVGYEGAYEVSSLGRVRSLARLDSRGRRRSARDRALARQQSGHLTVALCRDGVRTTVPVHRLVLEAFVGPCPRGLEACHRNDVPPDNRLENLRWDTRGANVLDSVRNGTHHMARRTHCPQGHGYTPENTYRYPAGNRACNECRREYRETHREERRASGREYARRRRAAVKTLPTTHCPNGHEYGPADALPSGGHRCAICKRECNRAHYERNRDLYIERARQWRLANPERAREVAREAARRYRATRKAA